MIIGIGIDSVNVARFSSWHAYSLGTLEKIYSKNEVEYCISNRLKSAERFALRFATKEAFFKAWCSASDSNVTLSGLLRLLEVTRTPEGVPALAVDWESLLSISKTTISPPRIHLSCTHTKTVATAFVILEKRLTKS